MIGERKLYDRAMRTPLAPCSKCGLTTGERKMTKKEPTLFYVVCSNCGHHTKGHISQDGATRAWNKEGKDG